MKRIAVILLIMFSFFVLSCAKGGKTNEPVQTSSQSSTDWKSWLIDYEKFVDDFIVIIKKIEAGDKSTTVQAISFATRGQELATQAIELNKTLSDEEKVEFEAAYKNIQQKLEDAGMKDSQ